MIFIQLYTPGIEDRSTPPKLEIDRRVLSNLIDELHGSLSASVSAANKTFSRPRDRSSSSRAAAAADVQPPGVT